MSIDREDIENIVRLSEQVAQVNRRLEDVARRLDEMPKQWSAFLTRAEHEVHLKILHEKMALLEQMLKAQSLTSVWDRIIKIAVGITAIIAAGGAILMIADYLRHRPGSAAPQVQGPAQK